MNDFFEFIDEEFDKMKKGNKFFIPLKILGLAFVIIFAIPLFILGFAFLCFDSLSGECKTKSSV